MSITCPHCGQEFPGEKLNARHLAKCNPESSPKVPPCLCGHTSTSLTQMKRHRQSCPVWTARDSRAVRVSRRVQTNLERYGVEDATHTAEVIAKRAETNLGRYGATNPFSRGASTFQAVQAALEGKRPVLRGSDNPFAKPEIQMKIRAAMVARFGVENPQQVPEIRAKTQQTNLDRYGVEEPLASPEIRGKIRATCEEVYGGPAPSCSPEVQARQQVTNQARYGVPWTAMDAEVRRKQLEAMEAKYGSHYFASDEGKAEIRRTMKERYGVEFPGEMEGHWERALETFRRNHPDVAYPHLLARGKDGPNKFEQGVAALAPEFLFTGEGAFWKWLPLLGHHKNPDFILPGPDPARSFKGVTKVIEAFGSFWHSRMFTGKANWDHEQELVAAYAGIGIDCLIVWEEEFKADPQAVAERIRSFVNDPMPPLV